MGGHPHPKKLRGLTLYNITRGPTVESRDSEHLPLSQLLWRTPHSLGRIRTELLHMSWSPTVVAPCSSLTCSPLHSRAVHCKVTYLATLETLSAPLPTRSSLARNGATNSSKTVRCTRDRIGPTTSCQAVPGTRTTKLVLLPLSQATRATGTWWTRERESRSEGHLGLPLRATSQVLLVFLLKTGSHLNHINYRRASATHHLHHQARLKAFQKSICPPLFSIEAWAPQRPTYRASPSRICQHPLSATECARCRRPHRLQRFLTNILNSLYFLQHQI